MLTLQSGRYSDCAQGPTGYCDGVSGAFSCRIVGGSVLNRIAAGIVIDTLERARRRRRPASGMIAHADSAAQGTPIRFAETLAPGGHRRADRASGDAYDNAFAESAIGLYKNEAIREDSPFRTRLLQQLEDVGWVLAAPVLFSGCRIG